ncbi:3-phosphoshikimate 1-carboxyvinyltransferase [Rhodohalobacter sp. SW132]|uniref:3-phosphoshikimate 1-carboxyvinyltransferase n=1 Tax=Rhodohalobacter sp. SW132 TaxID=2293433 RepID=UPI000E26C53D|nr:3-phosphoshikimate 1-carboxyvinyltransferase [Rhodohalobacter sp. SW132]REL24851.1 3-phosphoshikimate 1-carboxyvinyltransferase [Rhodohalobacter sp. SW132]
MTETVRPASGFNGTIQLPPDKSISHRAALFAAISDEKSIIENYSEAADPASTLSCLKQLGIQIEREKNRVTIQGVGRKGFINPATPLDCGNSGTTMRLLTGILAGAGVTAELTGDDSLSGRTMKRIIEPLRRMGATISAQEDEFAPISLKDHSGIKPMRYTLPIASAQLKSCVLLAGLFGDEPTEVIEQTPSRDHTERLLNLTSEPYGQGKIIRSSSSDTIPAQSYTVPGDFSAAAFWMVGAAIQSGSELILKNVGINPSRTGILHVLKQMGANITLTDERMQGSEPVADMKISNSSLQPIDLDPKLIPNCIDELPILMVAFCFANGRSTIRGAEELRHKETDRLSAMHEILTNAGAETTLRDDGIEIEGDPDFKPQNAEFNSYHDHRMAMAAAILSSKAGGESSILDADCTAISYPNFWKDLKEVSG